MPFHLKAFGILIHKTFQFPTGPVLLNIHSIYSRFLYVFQNFQRIVKFQYTVIFFGMYYFKTRGKQVFHFFDRMVYQSISCKYF